MRPVLRFIARREGWIGRLEPYQLDLFVPGDEIQPRPELAPIFWNLVDDFPACQRAVEAYCAALPADTPLIFTPRPGWFFSAGTSGFADGGFDYVSLVVDSPRPRLHFTTGRPDGYAIYEAVLDGVTPVSITASCW